MTSRNYFFLLLVLGFLLSGCAGSGSKALQWSDPAIDKIWPVPPEQPRIRLLRTLSPKQLIDSNETSNRLFRWVAGEITDILPLISPYAVATDGHGTIWVTDSGQQLIHVFDLNSGSVEYLTGVGNSRFEMPTGIFFDSRLQHLYIADSLAKRVFKLDRHGNLIAEIGSSKIFQRPAGLALDLQQNLLVADVLAGVVHRLSPEGKTLLSYGSSLTENGLFSRPTAVSVGHDGTVYVLDVLNFRVEKLSPEGKSRGQIGELGDVPGTFSRPRGLAVDEDGNVFVSDAAFDNVQIFNSQGQLLMFFGRDKHWPLSLPAGMTIDAAGRLIVADTFNRRLMIYQLLSGAEKIH